MFLFKLWTWWTWSILKLLLKLHFNYSWEWMALINERNFSVKTSFQMVYFLWVSIFSSWHISSSCLTSCALFLLLKPLTFNSSFNPFTVLWEKSVYFLVDLEGDSHFKFHLIVADVPDLNFLLLFSPVFSNFNIPVAFFALCVTVYS